MARACDRCSRLKTQCNGDLPCNRCQRLALECTQTRPILAKGRPKRDAAHPRSRRHHASHRHASESASPKSVTYSSNWPTVAASDFALELVRRLPELPVPEPIAAHLLDFVLSSVSTIGILEVFSGIHDASARQGFHSAHSKRMNNSLATVFQSKALLYTLIALGATICGAPDLSINITSLQQYALNSVPALYGNSRDLRIDDALALCFLSYLGCIDASSIKVAERWAVLAVVISRQASENDAEQTAEWEAFRRKASLLIRINDRIFSLLHHRQPFDQHVKAPKAPSLNNSVKPLPSIADKMSIGGVLEQPPAPPKNYMKTDYFSLFGPLLQSIDLALDEPRPGTPEWEMAIEGLEQYHAEFPLSLLSYTDVRLLHQAEVMVWFHGIFLLLHGKRDLYSAFEDQSWIASPDFGRAAEHALLLGEAIPTLARVMATASQLSPATIYFILLSSVIHAVALRQMLGTPMTVPRFGLPSDPDRTSWANLLESTRLHIYILQKIREDSFTCNVDLVPGVEAILQGFFTAASTGRNEREVDLSVLKLYRWVERGHGIVKISPRVAEELSRSGVAGVNGYGVPDNGSENIVSGKREILALCDPRTRRCRHGVFALSIRGNVR